MILFGVSDNSTKKNQYKNSDIESATVEHRNTLQKSPNKTDTKSLAPSSGQQPDPTSSKLLFLSPISCRPDQPQYKRKHHPVSILSTHDAVQVNSLDLRQREARARKLSERSGPILAILNVFSGFKVFFRYLIAVESICAVLASVGLTLWIFFTKVIESVSINLRIHTLEGHA
uniref:Uncharacterized protein n=1 Tax=Corethron hystrix TaxID=216773 RepID=A0A6U5JMN0_9STRA